MKTILVSAMLTLPVLSAQAADLIRVQPMPLSEKLQLDGTSKKIPVDSSALPSQFCYPAPGSSAKDVKLFAKAYNSMQPDDESTRGIDLNPRMRYIIFDAAMPATAPEAIQLNNLRSMDAFENQYVISGKGSVKTMYAYRLEYMPLMRQDTFTPHFGVAKVALCLMQVISEVSPDLSAYTMKPAEDGVGLTERTRKAVKQMLLGRTFPLVPLSAPPSSPMATLDGK